MVTGSSHASRRLIAAFVLLLLLPAGTVAWLGFQLLRQDRELAATQARERRDVTADRAVGELERALSHAERALMAAAPSLPSSPNKDLVVVSLDADEVDVQPPGVLLYYPVPPAESDFLAAFAAGEAMELRANNLDAAATEYRRLTSPRFSPDVRAEALVRLARTLKNAARTAEALQAYDELQRMAGARVAGVPADLAARRAKAGLLERLGRREELRAAAIGLRARLLSGTWTVDRGAFEAYLRQTEIWLADDVDVPGERQALSAAVERLVTSYRRGTIAAAGRSATHVGGTEVTVLWQTSAGRLRALVAGPRFVTDTWLEPTRVKLRREHATSAVDFQGEQHSGATSDGAASRRSAAETGLPWTVTVRDRPMTADSAGIASQRRTIVAGVTLLLLSVTTGGYLTARAIGRELALARLQTDFVAAVSHEFRTPLTAIRQFTALLIENDDLERDKRVAFYGAQARATERLAKLVESLLDFGRMEAGAHPYSMEPINVEQLVSETLDEFRRDPAAATFAIACTVDRDAGVVSGDWDALSRALRNLLENAVNYSDASRNIEVKVTREVDTIGIAVQDRGFGVGPEEQRQIFKKFVRGAITRQRGIKGTGVGLAIVAHIAAAHRGRIDLESEVGRGSTFTLWLPRAH